MKVQICQYITTFSEIQKCGYVGVITGLKTDYKSVVYSIIGNLFKYHASGIISTQRFDVTRMRSSLSPDPSDNISPISNKTIANTTNFHGGVAGVFNVTERVTKSDGNSIA